MASSQVGNSAGKISSCVLSRSSDPVTPAGCESSSSHSGGSLPSNGNTSSAGGLVKALSSSKSGRKAGTSSSSSGVSPSNQAGNSSSLKGIGVFADVLPGSIFKLVSQPGSSASAAGGVVACSGSPSSGFSKTQPSPRAGSSTSCGCSPGRSAAASSMGSICGSSSSNAGTRPAVSAVSSISG